MATMATEDQKRSRAKTDTGERICALKEQMDKLEAAVKVLTMAEVARKAMKSNRWKGNRESTTEEPSGPTIDLIDDASSSNAPLSEEEKLHRLINEMHDDIRGQKFDLPLLKAKMERVNELYANVMVQEMRTALATHASVRAASRKPVGEIVEMIDPEDLTDEMLIAAMDGGGVPEMSLAEYKKKPEQAKGISRNVWVEQLKMAKKFAECFSHMCTVHRSGNTENLDCNIIKSALGSVQQWEEKWRKNASMMMNIRPLVAYEIICRVENFEFYNCLFCNVVYFNAKQFLAHFSTGTHCSQAQELISTRGKSMCFGYADKILLNLTSVCDDFHAVYSQVFTTPLIKSGAKVPPPDIDSIPTLEYLREIEKKYGKAINGNLDATKFDDSAYVASKLPGIIERHKSAIGKKLFKELHEYLEKGTNIYCRRCLWKMSNRASFYRHIQNPYHVSMHYMKDGLHFNLLTVSINVHLRGELS